MRIALFLAIVFLTFSCRKDAFTSDASALLATSEDTLHFDTVFTTAGSTTQRFKIFNKNDQGLRIASITLGGGAGSPFKINANGTPGPQISNLDLAAGDSAYVFVTVHIDPTSDHLPFVVRDSVEIDYNGNKRKVQLEAFGQNARFLRNQIISGNETWEAGLPYVILGGLRVDQGAQLTINQGCNIYLHADAPLLIDGTLQVQGEKWDSTRVTFATDRLDAPYRDFPAGCPGIVFGEHSTGNRINYAIIKNAYQAIVVQESPAGGAAPKLTLTQTIIDNAYDAGIIAANTSIWAENLLISNCGKNLVLVNGGHYQFTHCTVASIANPYVPHKEPVLFISNYLPQNPAVSRNLTALFRNCLFWGEGGGLVEDEVVVAKNGNALFNVTFDNVLWKVKAEPVNATITGKKINNMPPEFDSVNTAKHLYNFRLKESSPALNAGAQTGVSLDLDGQARPVGLPDLGAYERQ